MDALLHQYLSSFPILLLLTVIAITLYTLSKGADVLVDEAVALSIQIGVPKLIIGATIVSLGTTLPEATVSVLAAVNGNPDLALGNAIGSVIVDTGLIIGIAALLGKLPIDDNIVKVQGRIQFLCGILLAVVSIPVFIATGDGHILQSVGFLFIALLIAYIFFSIRMARRSNVPAEIEVEDASPLPLRLLKLALGIALIILSSKVLIPSVEITALRVGIPESIIAATLVAFGTSLPELVTAVTAVRKGHGELAVGNVVGADILNVLFVVGSAAAVTKGGLPVPGDFYRLQIPAMILILGAFRLFSTTREREITKVEGSILFGFYAIYLFLNYFWIV